MGTSNKIVVLFIVKEIPTQTPQWNSDREIWMHRALSSQSQCLWLIKTRELLSICDDAVDSSGYGKKYKNNLIWLVNYPKIRAAKTLDTGYPSKNLWMNSHFQRFLYVLLKRLLPFWGYFLEEESSLLPTFQSCMTDTIAEPKCQSNLLFNLPKFLH